MMDKNQMTDCVRGQLALDYNCSPDDFMKDGIFFTEAVNKEGRRSYPWRSPRIEMIAMGNSMIINASNDIMPLVRKQFKGHLREEILCLPFFYGINIYYLPDVDKIVQLEKPAEFEYKWFEKSDLSQINKLKKFGYVLGGSSVELVIAAIHNGKIIGMAGTKADCEKMRVVNVDVLKKYRNKGIATALVNMLTLEVLNRGLIPYYYTGSSNTASLRTAVKAGYFPAWVHTYRAMTESKSLLGRIKNNLRIKLKRILQL
jgi:GNAT superfamily N-acetyltransferase